MAKKAYSPDPKAETIKRIQRTEAYAEKVRQLFAATVNEILALNKSVPTLDEGVMYSFDGDNMRIQKKVEALLRQLHSVVTTAIRKGITLEWEQANVECDKLVASCFGKKVLSCGDERLCRPDGGRPQSVGPDMAVCSAAPR